VLAGVLAAGLWAAGGGAARATVTAPATTATVHFVQTATTANIATDSTFINNPATNGQPNALLFVTPNWNPVGSSGVYNNHPVGVWYSVTFHQWAVFNEDGATMPPGPSFNVLVVHAASSSAFVVRATSSNTTSDYTRISSSLTNGKPSAQIQVTQNYNPGGGIGHALTHPVGVWYTGTQWAAFNEDQAAMPTGVAFNVMVGSAASGGGTLMLQTGTAGNSLGDFTLINSTKVNADSDGFVFETPNYNPGGASDVYNAPPTGVFYSGGNHKMAVFNEDDSTPSTHGAAFNLVLFTA
jgi:hypothetical protein